MQKGKYTMLTAYLIISSIVMGLWLFINGYITATHSVKEMKENFVCDQNTIGKVCANIFYIPAWLCKGIKFLVNIIIK